MTTLDNLHVLPADMRGSATGFLFDTLKVSRGKPVTLDASAVQRMDALTPQFFALVAKTWATDEQPFKIVRPSEKVSSTMSRLGLAEFVAMESDANDN